jgi:hypothetical protein
MPDPQPRPTRPRALTRKLTNAAVSLQKTLSGGTDEHGDISTWNPALGEAVQDVTSLAAAPTSSSKRNGKQMDLDPRKNGEMGWRKYVKYFTPSYVAVPQDPRDIPLTCVSEVGLL